MNPIRWLKRNSPTRQAKVVDNEPRLTKWQSREQKQRAMFYATCVLRKEYPIRKLPKEVRGYKCRICHWRCTTVGSWFVIYPSSRGSRSASFYCDEHRPSKRRR